MVTYFLIWDPHEPSKWGPHEPSIQKGWDLFWMVRIINKWDPWWSCTHHEAEKSLLHDPDFLRAYLSSAEWSGNEIDWVPMVENFTFAVFGWASCTNEVMLETVKNFHRMTTSLYDFSDGKTEVKKRKKMNKEEEEDEKNEKGQTAKMGESSWYLVLLWIQACTSYVQLLMWETQMLNFFFAYCICLYVHLWVDVWAAGWISRPYVWM